MPGDWSYENDQDKPEMIFSRKDEDGIYVITKINKYPLRKILHTEDIYEYIVLEVVRKTKLYMTSLDYKKQQVMHELTKI
ncbi:MAG: hypothetical protein KCHDKBKB_00751 [Elusimicrobia bacterium]|nr:hypothetical protein [Elusimicrobiota bacterium]